MPRKPVAEILPGTQRNLALLARRLRSGDIVGVPTETVYGLAADALNAKACRKIFTAKGRPVTDPLIVHLHSLRDLHRIAVANPAALKLAKAFWPGPLTLVLPKRDSIPAIVSAGLPSVAVRIPAHPLFRRLIKLVGKPLAAPSANPFGFISPTTAEHVRAHLGTKIRYILDGGPAKVGLESTIVDLRDPARPRLLRPGTITVRQLREVLGLPVARNCRQNGRLPNAPQVAPGSLLRHYSPLTPVVLRSRKKSAQIRPDDQDEAWLFLAKPEGRITGNIYWLDARGNLRNAARRLFAVLRDIDAKGYSKIHAELVRPFGDGCAEAINDRLRRAAAK